MFQIPKPVERMEHHMGGIAQRTECVGSELVMCCSGPGRWKYGHTAFVPRHWLPSRLSPGIWQAEIYQDRCREQGVYNPG